MSICKSPSRSQLEHCKSILENKILPNLLQQEVHHARSKRPRLRYAGEADKKIQRILVSVQGVKGRLIKMEHEFSNLEVKVDRLDLERENGQNHHLIHRLSFSMSPPPPPPPSSSSLNKSTSTSPSILSSLLTPSPPRRMMTRRTSKPRSPEELMMISPSSPGQGHSLSPKFLEYLRKRNLLDINLTRIYGMIKTEVEILQHLFQTNFNLLKFKRAEKCLLAMIHLQRKFKAMENSLFQVRDRLLHLGFE